jgi:hypothetical protein
MTYLDMQQELERQARLDLDFADDQTAAKFWLNRAQEEIEAYNPWWFLETEYSITLSNTLTYPFPSGLSTIDIDSMRTHQVALTHADSSTIDRSDPNWTVDTTRAGPGLWTIVGTNIKLNTIPSADYITTHENILFRGWKNMTTLTDDGDISDIPSNWHWVITQGALYRAWEERGDDSLAGRERAKFMQSMELMVARCRPVRGEHQRVAAPPIFRNRGHGGRRGVNVSF